MYAKNRNIDYGVSALDSYLNNLLYGKNVNYKIDFYKEIKRRDDGLKNYKLENSFTNSSGEKFYSIFSWDPNINWFSGVWLFERRRFYDNLPFFSAQEFIKISEKQKGVDSFYFIKVTEYGPLTTEKHRVDFSDNFEKKLIEDGAEVEEIRRSDGEVAFKVYKK